MLKLFIIIFLLVVVILPLNKSFAGSSAMAYRVSLTIPATVNMANEPNRIMTGLTEKWPVQVIQIQKVTRTGQEFLLRTIVAL